jgi:hypothetical protein
MVIGLCLALGLTSCKHKEGEYHYVVERIAVEGAAYDSVSVSATPLLSEIETLEVHVHGQRFLIPESKKQLKGFACTECHTGSLEDLPKRRKKKAHWDIKLQHADSHTMACTTCHNPDNMDQLTSLTGSQIDFDYSFRLCGQCHTQEYKDWSGGAHGKSLVGWAPPRASMTCVNCHNPHQPGFPTKWPVRFNSQVQKERE